VQHRGTLSRNKLSLQKQAIVLKMDFRLKVFESAARNLSFTLASRELRISQPAISKHIQELESLYKVQLFVRSGTKISITREGEMLLSHTERILNAFRQLEYEMNLLTNHYTGTLRIGASSTLSQYIIPPLLASFLKKFPEMKLSVISGNSHEIEKALLEKRIDLGMIEGNSRNTNLHYSPFLRDELVAITSTQSMLAEYDEISPLQLKQMPLVVRENGSGSLEVIETALLSIDLKLKDLSILMQLGSTESIKLFLDNSDSIGIVSIHAVSKDLAAGRFKVIDISGLTIKRSFQFIQNQGETLNITENFIRFAKRQFFL